MDNCKLCNKNEGFPYIFLYGKLSKEIEQFKNINSTSTIVEHINKYKMEGSSSEPVGDACIRKERSKRVFTAIAWSIIIPAIFIGSGFLMKILPSEGIWDIFAIIFFILLIFGFLFEVNNLIHLIQAIFIKKNALGEELALEIGRKELEKKSREFWTETEFTKLKIKQLNKRL